MDIITTFERVTGVTLQYSLVNEEKVMLLLPMQIRQKQIIYLTGNLQKYLKKLYSQHGSGKKSLGEG
ncbi:MAG: hypothetical protein CM15mP32_0760 [Flavobacteriaceae bacterium]|nr:MAG: hypothetical protein CM15mP32_0760 [Flavobacteriaceae bacterium]